MDIFYVLNSRWPTTKAYGVQVAKTCQGLKQSGARVRLVVPVRARHKQIRGIDPFELYGIRDRFRLVRLLSLDFTRLHLDGKVFFYIQQGLFALFAAGYLLFKKGAVYSRDQFTLYFLSFFRHDIYWELHRLPKDTDSAVYCRLLSRVRGIVTITDGIRNGLIERGVPVGKILVASDGIDLREFDAPRSDVSLDSSKHTVMYVGQLIDWKGVDTLVEAAQLLDDRFQVVVVGGELAGIQQLASRDRSGKIRFEPFMPHSRAIQWMRSADILVLPNKKDGGVSEFYTSPLKMFEYMATGKCIVASDLPSIREVLNERNAVLVIPDSAQALADGIVKVATDREFAQHLGTQARTDVERYTWQKRGQRILDFISQKT